MKGHLPISFDLDQHLNNFPPEQYGLNNFNRDFFIYLLSQIVLVPSSNRKVLDNIENGFVPLSSTLLQSVVHDYAKYWEYLANTEVVIINRKYNPKIFGGDGKCKGYRWGDRYSQDLFNDVKYSIKFEARLRSKNKRELRSQFEKLKSYRHVLKWIYPSCKLTISYDKARQFLELEKKALLLEPNLREKRNRGKDKIFKTGKTKDPYYQFDLALINIEKIENKEWSFTIDDNVKRLHTALTNMRSVLRNYIKYDGQELVSIDLRNSQPYLSTKLLRKEFWATTPINNNNKIIITNNKITNTPYMLEIIEQLVDSQQLIEYETYVGGANDNGDIYSFMEEKYDEKGIPHDGRGFIKSGLFEVFFSSNRYSSTPKKVFRDIFPLINKIFELIKDKDNASLPILLQRMESYIFLEIITKSLALRFPNAPIFTIHDSIVTTTEYCERFKSLMFQILSDLIGIEPMLKIEYWNESDQKLNERINIYREIVR